MISDENRAELLKIAAFRLADRAAARRFQPWTFPDRVAAGWSTLHPFPRAHRAARAVAAFVG